LRYSADRPLIAARSNATAWRLGGRVASGN
jgi:hypothetical protein